MNTLATLARAVVLASFLALSLGGCDSTMAPDPATSTHQAALSADKDDYTVNDGYYPPRPPKIDKLCPPKACWKNHGEYVSCVAHAVNDLRKAGVLTVEQAKGIVAAAGQSDIGKDKSACKPYGGGGY